VNGTSFDCTTSGGATYTLPAARNGGYCVEAGAGLYAYAYFSTF